MVTQHFAPEITAGRFRLESFARGITDLGHEVDVVCPVPSHPEGEVHPGYRGRILRRQRRGRLSVVYVPVFNRPVKTTATRLGYYGSYAAGALLAGSLRRRPDLVLASSPPLSVGVAGALLATRYGCPLVFDVRDLWPESAVALGELPDGVVARAAEVVERSLYRRARLVLTPNRAFAAHIAKRAGDAGKVEEIPNGTTREWLDAGERDPDGPADRTGRDRFVLAYAGNLGLAHALDEAIEAAALLGDGIRLVIAGEGPRRGPLRELASRIAPGSVEFRGLVSPEEAARVLRRADAVLVAERQAKTVSAKLYDCCAVGRPVIVVGQGELLSVVERERIGLPVPLGDPGALAGAVRRVRDDHELVQHLTARARDFAEASLRELQAARVARLLETVVANRAQSPR